MRKRIDAEHRRKQVLDRVTAVFVRRGFSAATTAELARASGISEAMLYKLFGSKRGVYAALIQRKIGRDNEGQHPIDTKTNPGDESVLTSIGADMLTSCLDDPAFIRLLLYSALEGNELATLFYEARVKRLIEQTARYIRRRIREGAFRKVDPELAAMGFLGTIGQYVLTLQVFRYPTPCERHPERVVKTFVDITLHGLAR